MATCFGRRAPRLTALFVVLVAGCGAQSDGGGSTRAASTHPGPVTPTPLTGVAECYTGHGINPDGGGPLIASLRLTAAGRSVTGTYVVGATAAQGVEFAVRGTLDKGRFDGTFTTAGQAVKAVGAMSPQAVVLDGGQGFAITRFTPGGDAC